LLIQAATASPVPGKTPTVDTRIVLDDQVLIDKKDVFVKIEDIFVRGIDGWLQVWMTVQNNTGRKIEIRAESVSVNGYMVESMFASNYYFTIYFSNNNDARGCISFSVAGLRRAGITAIREFEMILVASDLLTEKEIARSKTVTLHNRAFDTEQRAPDTSGTLIHDKANVKIVAFGIRSTIAPIGLERTILPLYIENNSKQPLHFVTRKIIVNGVPVHGALAITVEPGKKAFCEILVNQVDLDANQIRKVDTAALSLHAFNARYPQIGTRLNTKMVTLQANE
jgi:hypothetical protein